MKSQAPLAMAACALFLGACAVGPKPQPKYFLLNPGAPPSFAGMQSEGTAAVSFVDVGAPYSSDGFVYKLSDGQWEVDPYNQFLVSPAEMMTGVLRNWLHQSRLFRNVAIPGEGGGQMFLIDCDLTELYGDFENPSRPAAVMIVEVQMFRRTGNEREIVLRKTFKQSVPFGERNPETLVDAWNEALRVNLDGMLRALAEAAD